MFLPALLLVIVIQQCTVQVVLSTPLKALEQQSLGTEQEGKDDQGWKSPQNPQARTFEGDILITQDQLEDHYGTPTGLDEESAEDSHVSRST